MILIGAILVIAFLVTLCVQNFSLYTKNKSLQNNLDSIIKENEELRNEIEEYENGGQLPTY